jgi:hypothetical protein
LRRASDESHVDFDSPILIEKSILHARLQVQGRQAIPMPGSVEIKGAAGETRYLTVDFGRPVHGYPFLSANVSETAPIIDFAYGELSRSPLTGKPLVEPDGWNRSRSRRW